MGYLAIQIAGFLTIALITGAIAGWWVARFIYLQYEAECRTELAGLHRNYDDAVLENASLRHKLREMEKVVRKACIPPSDTDYGKFLQLRKALEKNRRQYEALLDQFQQQEKGIARLKGELLHSKKQLAILREESGKHTDAANWSTDAVSPTAASGLLDSSTRLGERDDLTCIQGINKGLAGKLQAMGILSYRQVAEFTPDDLHNIQRIIGVDVPSEPDGWVQNARSLFQQKYQQLQA